VTRHFTGVPGTIFYESSEVCNYPSRGATGQSSHCWQWSRLALPRIDLTRVILEMENWGNSLEGTRERPPVDDYF